MKKYQELVSKYHLTYTKLGVYENEVQAPKQVIKTEKYFTPDEANLVINELIKKKGFIKHQGRIVNLIQGIEVKTNFI